MANIQEGTQERRRIPIEERRQMRHDSRVSQTYKKFLHRIEDYGFTEQQAEKAAVAVLCTLEQRLFGNEPAHLEAQLPQVLKDMLQSCEIHAKKGPALEKFGRDEFCRRVAEHYGESSIEPEHIVRAVFGAVRDHISEGEVDDIINQLPSDLQGLWAPVI